MRVTEKVTDTVEVRLVGKNETVLSTFFLAAERRTYEESCTIRAEWVMPDRITWMYTASEPVTPQYLEYRVPSLDISWLWRPWLHRKKLDVNTMKSGDTLMLILPTKVLRLKYYVLNRGRYGLWTENNGRANRVRVLR